MYKLGLKLWSINTDYYYDEAIHLYNDGIFDYIELYIVPKSLETLGKWKKLNIPFIIHCPHFAHGFNLAKSEKKESNRKIFDEVQKFADTLKVPYIVIHGGIDGNIEETAKQLASFKEPRALIENKPYIALPNRMGGNFCRGYNIDEIKLVIDIAKCGFCFDFGHAICAANSLYDSISSPLAGEGKGEGLKKASHFYSKQSLEYSKELRKNMTEPEQILWYHLRNRQLDNLKFRRQEAIGEYIADFVCYEKKLIIELDGGGHLDATQLEHDKQRDLFFKNNCFNTLRIFNTEVFSNIEGVIEKILFITNNTPHPNPLPHGAREQFIYDYIEDFTKLNPNMYHLTDIEDITSPYDSHPHLGTGQLDIKRILKLIPENKYITVETNKNNKENLDDFIEDMKWFKNIQ